VVVNAIANVGAIIEREKPKASIAPKDLRRFGNCIPSFDKGGERFSFWIAIHPRATGSATGNDHNGRPGDNDAAAGTA